MQARELAQNRAEAIANAARASAGDTPELIVQNLRELENTLQNEIANLRLSWRIKAAKPAADSFKLFTATPASASC